MDPFQTPPSGSGSGAHSMLSSVLLSRSQIQEKVFELAVEIDECYRRRPFTMLVVMDGAMIFASDLSRAITGPHSIQSVTCKSYQDGKISKHLKITHAEPAAGSQILIVEDIIDTGRTMTDLIRHLDPSKNDIKVVSLIERTHHDPAADWIGFQIGPGFIYGYGLDDEYGLGRGLKDIWVRGVDRG